MTDIKYFATNIERRGEENALFLSQIFIFYALNSREVFYIFLGLGLKCILILPTKLY